MDSLLRFRGAAIDEVEVGSKGWVVDGVRRALKCVDIVSSIVERDVRRKSRSRREWKQKDGVRFEGGGGGVVMMSLLVGFWTGLRGDFAGEVKGEGEGQGGEGEGEGKDAAQNQDASLGS